MNEFYISKSQLWCEAIETAEVLLKTRLVNLERGKEKLTPGECKAVTAMKLKLTSFIKYGEAAHSSWRMNAG